MDFRLLELAEQKSGDEWKEEFGEFPFLVFQPLHIVMKLCVCPPSDMYEWT